MPSLSEKHAPPASRRRPPLPRLSSNPDTRSVQIGVIGTVLIHVLLLLIAPKLESRFGGARVVPVGQEEPTYEVELASDDFVIPKAPPPPSRFVEANPDAPENEPDKTRNFSSQSQQVAQEKPDPNGKSESPSTEGEKDSISTAIVSGDGAQSTPPAPPPMPAISENVTEAAQEATRRAQDILPGMEKIEGDSPDGLGANLEKIESPTNIGPEKLEGQKDASPDGTSANGAYFKVDPSRPQPRQVLSRSQIRPSILSERVEGTSNIGIIAHNALKTTFGEYLNRTFEAIEMRWEKSLFRKLDAGLNLPHRGSTVSVIFALHKDGSVTVAKVEGAEAGDFWTRVAVDAIAESAPYGVWTDQMIAILGDSTEVGLIFRY